MRYFLLLKKICEPGIFKKASSPFQKTPLHVASECGYLSVARVLLEGGADVNRKDKSDVSGLLRSL